MCGFIGMFGPDASDFPVEKYGKIISYRGPDCHTTIETPLLHICFSRLAILPPLDKNGISEYKGSLLVLNGEIYFDNLVGLTDTEYLHHKLIDEGFSILQELNGQFAFALFKDNSLYLGRDHLGIKPLYYSRLSPEVTVFASEIKAISQIPQISKELNQEVIECFKGIGYNLFSGETCFKKIHSVEAGELLRIDCNQQIEKEFFFEYDNSLAEEPALALDAVQEELDAGIRRCVIHDQCNSKALFLSGGLDSGYLLARGLKYSPISPFTLWDGVNVDDITDARLLCKTLNVPLAEDRVQWPFLDKMIVNYAWHFEMPIGGGGFDLLGGIAFHVLAQKIANSGFKVALCGEGADELFLGYHQYHMEPSILRKKLDDAISRYDLNLLKLKLMEINFFQDPEPAARFIAVKHGLAEYHLQSVDRSGMAFGLEVRPPFVNHKLAVLLKKIQAKNFIDRTNNWTKIPLRKIFSQSVPITEARSAIRRKRAMTYSLFCFDQKITEILREQKATITAAEAFWRLFFFLHVNNNFTSCPDITFSELVPELEKAEAPL